MPETRVLIYAAEDGTVPLLAWLDAQPAKVQDKVLVRVERLRSRGHELRRPEAEYLGGGIYELRIRHRRENYRVLYFYWKGHAVLSHGLEKERRVPPQEIERAARRMSRFAAAPADHVYRE